MGWPSLSSLDHTLLPSHIGLCWFYRCSATWRRAWSAGRYLSRCPGEDPEQPCLLYSAAPGTQASDSTVHSVEWPLAWGEGDCRLARGLIRGLFSFCVSALFSPHIALWLHRTLWSCSSVSLGLSGEPPSGRLPALPEEPAVRAY